MPDPSSRRINWPRIFAEGVVIVASILLALAADAWWEERRERADEVAVLAQLAQSLELDLERLTADRATEERIAADVRALLEHLESDDRYSAELQAYFNSVIRWVSVTPNAAAYESLKSRGLDPISDDVLRLRLIDYYETEYPQLQDTYLNDRAFGTDTAYPFFHSNFRQVDIEGVEGVWIPLDYDALRADPYFANLCRTKLRRVQSRILPAYDVALSLIHELLADIEAELRG